MVKFRYFPPANASVKAKVPKGKYGVVRMRFWFSIFRAAGELERKSLAIRCEYYCGTNFVFLSKHGKQASICWKKTQQL